MVKVKVQYLNNNIEIEFPIDESNLLSQLQTLFKDENDKQFSKSTKFLIDEVIEPKGLSVIKDSVVNLDELNYLAKRMDSFVNKELQQFYATANCFGINKMNYYKPQQIKQ